MKSPSKSKLGLESDFKQEITKIPMSDEDVSQDDPNDIYEDSSNEVSVDTSDTLDDEESSEKGIAVEKMRSFKSKFGLESDSKQEKTKILMSDEDVSQDDPDGIYVDSSYGVSVDTSDTLDNKESSAKGRIGIQKKESLLKFGIPKLNEKIDLQAEREISGISNPDDALKWTDKRYWHDKLGRFWGYLVDKRNWQDINGGFWGWLVVLTSCMFNKTVGKYDQTTYIFFLRTIACAKK